MLAVARLFRTGLVVGLLAGAASGVAACSGKSTPTPPTPPPVMPPPPPPPTANTPPSITTLTLSSPRVEADEDVGITAVVEDADTPLDKLTYEWSSTPDGGVFTGQGRSVRWTAPHLKPTPDMYTLTLTVTENYTDPSSGESKQFKTSKSTQVRYNDSYRDVSKIGMRFLTELFPTFSITPDQAVQDFSDNCPGKFAERDEIALNRKLFRIESGTFAISSITLNQPKTSGTVVGTCVFKDTIVATGVKETVNGKCTLTTVYEDWRWYLCDSTFAGTGTTTSTSLYGRVPGRVISPR